MEGVHFPSRLAWDADRAFLTGQHLLKECEKRERERAANGTRSAAEAHYGNLMSSNAIRGTSSNGAHSLPREDQELLLVTELFSALQGIEGRFVKARLSVKRKNAVEFFEEGAPASNALKACHPRSLFLPPLSSSSLLSAPFYVLSA
eukprot:TRINITY_DN6393_c0_g1_i1.p1 TRINITY_DN6393_c0_g1~~TRINITY_DN6393_c0_g1_i1.p1  ORF type:complete len:147 (-),score=37.28 TRINITY_DN6393_c0_g1_i1:593-1033(-)